MVRPAMRALIVVSTFRSVVGSMREVASSNTRVWGSASKSGASAICWAWPGLTWRAPQGGLAGTGGADDREAFPRSEVDIDQRERQRRSHRAQHHRPGAHEVADILHYLMAARYRQRSEERRVGRASTCRGSTRH